MAKKSEYEKKRDKWVVPFAEGLVTHLMTFAEWVLVIAAFQYAADVTGSWTVRGFSWLLYAAVFYRLMVMIEVNFLFIDIAPISWKKRGFFLGMLKKWIDVAPISIVFVGGLYFVLPALVDAIKLLQTGPQ